MAFGRTRTYLGRLLIPLLLWAMSSALPGAAGATEPTPGAIAGTVTGIGGGGLGEIEVCAYKFEPVNQVEEGCSRSQIDGTYEIGGLVPGEYDVVFWAFGDEVSRVYKGARRLADATPVLVTGGNVTSGIDEALDVQPPNLEPPSISGTVTAASTGLPVEGVKVCANREGGDVRCVETDAVGRYLIGELEPGQYRVFFYPEALGLGLVEQAWDERSSSQRPDAFVLREHSHAEGIDAALLLGSRIGGNVRLAASGAPLAQVTVCLIEQRSGARDDCLTTSASGEYVFEDVRPATYQVVFSPEARDFVDPVSAEEEAGLFRPDGYPTQWWDNEVWWEATPITIAGPGTIVRGVDGSLGPPAEKAFSSDSGPPGRDPTDLGSAAVPTLASGPGVPMKPPLACGVNRVRRKVNGKTRCVKRQRHAGHHRKPRSGSDGTRTRDLRRDRPAL
jgi:hypothetical protein